MFLHNLRLQRYASGTFMGRAAISIAASLEMFRSRGHKEKRLLQLIRKTRKERRSLVTADEAFIVHSLALAASKRPGAMAEVGVYSGGTARIICDAKADRDLHLFDTFAGLPKSSNADKNVYRSGQHTCTLESVSAYLQDYANIEYHVGMFPDTVDPITDLEFSFVNFDVDLYEGTLACLQFFYPRMIAGGVMISHDYSILSGVRQACDEFAATIPEGLIELPTTQCMFIKSTPATIPGGLEFEEPVEELAFSSI